MEVPEITFDSYFSDLGDSTLGNIIRVRSKRNKGKKLEDYEEELFQSTKLKLTKEEEEELAEIQEAHKREIFKAKEIVLKYKSELEAKGRRKR